MIFSFEASVVFQRIKNLNTLKGMDNREIDVHVFRGGRYVLNPTEPSTWAHPNIPAFFLGNRWLGGRRPRRRSWCRATCSR